MDQLEFLRQEVVEFSIIDFGVNMALCMIASFTLRAFYIRHSISLSGKFHIGTVIPILALVTFLVIMVVKSSLALSLGLVGALSVIRFRTPIKEPEELVYLFLSIALGLGYGAQQTFVTSLTFIIIMIAIWLWLSRTPANKRNEYNILINWNDDIVKLDQILDTLVKPGNTGDLLKYSSEGNGGSIFVKVLISKIDEIENIVVRVKSLDPKATVSFYEARPLQ